jgi:hypothetical protein
MSAVKKLLQEQDKDFISLHDLLIAIKDANNCTLGEAASVLLRLMSQGTKLSNPTLYSCTVQLGMVREVWPKQTVIDQIYYVAANGNFEYSDEIPF